MNIPLYCWTFLAMLRWAPVETLPQFPGHEETTAEAMARFGSIAAVIADVCTHESKRPQTCAAMLVAIGAEESHFSKDASSGPCWREGSYRTRCDSSAAAGPWQNHAYGRDAGGPITVARLFADHRLGARMTLRAARMCWHLPESDRMAGLTGSCAPSPTLLASARARMAKFRQVEAWKP